MVKAVAVLGSSEGVKGTIFFTQEGDGKPLQYIFFDLVFYIQLNCRLRLVDFACWIYC